MPCTLRRHSKAGPAKSRKSLTTKSCTAQDEVDLVHPDEDVTTTTQQRTSQKRKSKGTSAKPKAREPRKKRSTRKPGPRSKVQPTPEDGESETDTQTRRASQRLRRKSSESTIQTIELDEPHFRKSPRNMVKSTPRTSLGSIKLQALADIFDFVMSEEEHENVDSSNNVTPMEDLEPSGMEGIGVICVDIFSDGDEMVDGGLVVSRLGVKRSVKKRRI
jgi:hypothetical protein